jgi:hypothetical protein
VEPGEGLETKDQEVLNVKRRPELPAMDSNQIIFPLVKNFVAYRGEPSPPHDITFREIFN